MYPAVFPLSCSACTSICPLRSWRVLTKWVARTPNAKKREFSCLKKLKRLWEKTWLKSTRPSGLTQVSTMLYYYYVFWCFWIFFYYRSGTGLESSLVSETWLQHNLSHLRQYVVQLEQDCSSSSSSRQLSKMRKRILLEMLQQLAPWFDMSWLWQEIGDANYVQQLRCRSKRRSRSPHAWQRWQHKTVSDVSSPNRTRCRMCANDVQKMQACFLLVLPHLTWRKFEKYLLF